MRSTAKYASSAFQNHAKKIEGAKGNVPGFPNQFAIGDDQVPRKDSAPNSNKEFLNININGPMQIKQTQYQRAIFGKYESLPEDLPFDYRQTEKNQSLSALFGLGLIMVGLFL